MTMEVNERCKAVLVYIKLCVQFKQVNMYLNTISVIYFTNSVVRLQLVFPTGRVDTLGVVHLLKTMFMFNIINKYFKEHSC